MNVQDLSILIESRIEDEETPARVMAWAEKNQGKAIRKNNVPDGFEVRRQYGMTHLETVGYRRLPEGYSYLVARTEVGATVPTPEELRKLACPYYRGVEERNAQRRKLLADSDELARVAFAVNRAERAVDEYRAARAALQRATDNCPDWITLHDAAGITEEHRKLRA